MINVDNLSPETDKKELIAKHINDINNFEISFDYYSDFKNTKALRDFIEAISDCVNLSSLWKHRLILIADELNNNAIEYGSKPEDKNTMYLKIRKNENSIQLKMEITDSGKGPYPKTAEDMYKIQEDRLEKGFGPRIGIRGRGLFQIIHRTVDRLYFENASHGGLVVGIEKTLEI